MRKKICLTAMFYLSLIIVLSLILAYINEEIKLSDTSGSDDCWKYSYGDIVETNQHINPWYGMYFEEAFMLFGGNYYKDTSITYPHVYVFSRSGNANDIEQYYITFESLLNINKKDLNNIKAVKCVCVHSDGTEELIFDKENRGKEKDIRPNPDYKIYRVRYMYLGFLYNPVQVSVCGTSPTESE